MAQPKSPSVERAFVIPEVLEMIIAPLPIKDLLFAQRVSRRFKDTIDESPTLQQALFMAPIAPIHKGQPVAARVNPLLTHSRSTILAVFDQDRIPSAFSIKGVEHAPEDNPFWYDFHDPRCTCSRMTKVVVELTHLPYILHGPLASKMAREQHLPLAQRQQHQQQTQWAASASPTGLKQTKVYSVCSWRNMFPTQPPCPAEILNISQHAISYIPPVICGTPGGFTLGQGRLLEGYVASLGEFKDRIAMLEAAFPQWSVGLGMENLREVGVAEEIMMGFDV